MKELKFTKMNGAGNDFIVIDSIMNEYIDLTTQGISKLCDRRRGIGADGILQIKPTKDFDYELAYYNADGSLGSLCANGSRCSIKYASQNIYNKKKHISFICCGEVYSGDVINGEQIKFYLKDPSIIKIDHPIKYGDKYIHSSFLDTGSPHAVILWEDIKEFFNDPFEKFDIITFGKKVRNSREFSPKGTNVNVVKFDDQKLFIRTYERGVEDETQSCGTGTVASAIALFLIKKVKPPIKFQSFGGDELTVDFIAKNKKIGKITLTGPVKINYIGSCNF